MLSLSDSVSVSNINQVTKQREEALQAEEATKNQAGARYEQNIARIAQGVAITKGSLQRKSRRGMYDMVSLCIGHDKRYIISCMMKVVMHFIEILCYFSSCHAGKGIMILM